MKPQCPALAILVALIASPLWADDAVFLNPGQLIWQAAPPTLPKGAKLAVLRGDPAKSGPFTIRLSVPAGYKVPPHRHSRAESVTVISGSFHLGLGDRIDKAKAHELKAGGYRYLPAEVHHYAVARTRGVIQIEGEGPFDIHYLDPADKPEGK
ncbi:cupin domain-containing protein [Jeongeupia sp. USM3]|uniref:cupin domain-containing protein n=1 Tax=Jeongeupia sp. USM3 TaxID=1906741 RepID=UPI00089DDA1B|nr:cupin domain-containing protein [Jeongeupia sp. USM3]AOX99428.1 hypothetical protein BJP62_02525 [Jeongeupia sp. USM3]